MFKSLAVFCGSKNGNSPLYEQHAKELGKLIAENKVKLVYGGGNKGLMGAVADGVLQHGGYAIGVMPEILITWEQQHQSLSELHTVPDMHTRKRMMYDLCDAAIILPGGTGTLDEMFEMITWNTLNIHDKKIILLNSAGYYNSLLQHINRMFQEGFLYSDLRESIMVYNTPDAIFDDLYLDKY
jgi:uncharacterized protein (TIGR00730 family)